MSFEALATHRDWKDFLRFNVPGTTCGFARKSLPNKNSGVYEYDGETLTLRWENWASESIYRKSKSSVFTSKDPKNQFSIDLGNNIDKLELSDAKGRVAELIAAAEAKAAEEAAEAKAAGEAAEANAAEEKAAAEKAAEAKATEEAAEAKAAAEAEEKAAEEVSGAKATEKMVKPKEELTARAEEESFLRWEREVKN